MALASTAHQLRSLLTPLWTRIILCNVKRTTGTNHAIVALEKTCYRTFLNSHWGRVTVEEIRHGKAYFWLSTVSFRANLPLEDVRAMLGSLGLMQPCCSKVESCSSAEI